MIWLLDTDVVSALRRPERVPRLVAWLTGKNPDQLFLSAVTLGELERGIVRQEIRNPVFAADLRHWLALTAARFSDRILPFDASVAPIWGRLTANAGNTSADLIIAATALVHGATVATGNVAHFQPTGVSVENPF